MQSISLFLAVNSSTGVALPNYTTDESNKSTGKLGSFLQQIVVN